MNVFIAADHTGFILKGVLIEYIRDVLIHEVEDLGAATLDGNDDYPDYVTPCAKKVAASKGSLGIVIGGSGQGEAIAANRIPNVRAALYYGQAQATGPIATTGTPAHDG